MEYSEKLKDPRWQRRKNGILDRDNYTCQICDSVNKQLQVHHKYYIHGKEPWDYPDEILITLCVECHEKEGIAAKRFRDAIKELLDAGFTHAELLHEVNLFKHANNF
jgi:5-methylcytosine-specific restriction endonuclease McrA